MAKTTQLIRSIALHTAIPLRHVEAVANGLMRSDTAADFTRDVSKIQHVVSGSGSAVTFDGLKTLYWTMRAPHRANAAWLMSSATASQCDTIKDLEGRYVWRESVSADLPPTLLGRPVYFSEDMPAVTANAFPIAFANWSAAYIIADKPGVRWLRDPYSSKPNVIFYGYAAFHFHRITPYGVLANLAAMPVVSAIVMPMGLLGLVAMPFGFDGFFWFIMGLGIDWMISVTQWVAALPGAVGRVPAFGIGPLIAASLGIVLLGLLRTPLRWSGAALMLVAAIWAARVPQPDILISADGRNVGVRGQDGRLHLMHAAKGSRDAFLLREWLAADADPRLGTDASLTAGVSCDDAGCIVQAAGGVLIAQSLKPEALADDCERAALIVTARQVPAGCAASVIDADRLRRQGAMALRRSGQGFVVDAAKPRGIDRPWSPAVADDSDRDTAVLAPRIIPPRAVDATPAEADLQADE